VEPITVLVVDRERAVAQVMARRLDAEPSLQVIGCAQTAPDAAQLAISQRPSVVVLDEAVAGRALDELARTITQPEVGAHLVVTSSAPDSQRAFEAVRVGAVAFLTKASGFDEMVRVIRGAVRGESWIPPSLLTGVLHAFRAQRAGIDDDRRLQRLTGREREVLQLMVAGYGRARIAREMVVSVNTIRTHAQSILSKLEVHSSLEAVSVALQSGFDAPSADARRTRSGSPPARGVRMVGPSS
jgi:DNA-binding NarL/FixJ family response regulator